MKLIVLGVRNLGKLLSYLEEKGYMVEEATGVIAARSVLRKLGIEVT